MNGSKPSREAGSSYHRTRSAAADMKISGTWRSSPEQNEVRAAEMMDSIKRLAHIADIHDARISHLEGN